MDDHPTTPTAAGSERHNGWRTGQAVALVRGPLAGLRGQLVECNGQDRWLVSLDCGQRGVFVAVRAEDLLRQVPSGNGGAEITLPSLRPKCSDRAQE